MNRAHEQNRLGKKHRGRLRCMCRSVLSGRLLNRHSRSHTLNRNTDMLRFQTKLLLRKERTNNVGPATASAAAHRKDVLDETSMRRCYFCVRLCKSLRNFSTFVEWPFFLRNAVMGISGDWSFARESIFTVGAIICPVDTFVKLIPKPAETSAMASGMVLTSC